MREKRFELFVGGFVAPGDAWGFGWWEGFDDGGFCWRRRLAV